MVVKSDLIQQPKEIDLKVELVDLEIDKVVEDLEDLETMIDKDQQLTSVMKIKQLKKELLLVLQEKKYNCDYL
jgi:hypothetical protein